MTTGSRGSVGGDLLDIGHVGGDGGPAEASPARAFAVAAQAQGVGVEAAFGEVREEVLVPAPGGVAGAVDEEQGRVCGTALSLAGDDLQIDAPSDSPSGLRAYSGSNWTQSSTGERKPPEPRFGEVTPGCVGNLGRGFFIASSSRVLAMIASWRAIA